MKLTKKFLSALLVCAAAVTLLCAAAGATAAPVTAETPAQKQAVLDTINAVRQQNGLAPVAETADADAQADRMAALYFSTDDGDAYDAQWLAILDTEVEGKVSIGDCYSYKLQNGGGYNGLEQHGPAAHPGLQAAEERRRDDGGHLLHQRGRRGAPAVLR